MHVARHVRFVAAMLVATVMAASCQAQTPASVELELAVVATGFSQPLGVLATSDALYVVEKTGRVKVVKDGETLATPFLDLSDNVATQSEQGLLGLAFWPSETTSSDLTEAFVHYSDLQGRSVIARMPVRNGAAVPSEATTIFTIDQPYANHNGGQMAFGPDGLLYIGLGDGGSGGDPLRAGQDPSTPLGKILRIDVSDPAIAYATPSGNRYAPDEGLVEVWAEGLRNPWRFSFDTATNTLWIADVGQNAMEEINRVTAGRAGGYDFGWSTLEGDRCYRESDCEREGTTLPVAVYAHDAGFGRSVTGGYVYRGRAIPQLRGQYVFGDFISGVIMTLDPGSLGSTVATPTILMEMDGNIASFGLDGDGELLIVDYQGRLLRMVPR